jgi:hypothetical protein
MFVKAVPADTTGGGRLSPLRLQSLTAPDGEESESALPAELTGGLPLHRALPGPDGEPYGTDEQ